MLLEACQTALAKRAPVHLSLRVDIAGHILFNNVKLGLIQVEQETEGLPNFQTSLHNPGFAVYAKLGGGQGFHISDLAELEPTLKMAFASCKHCVVDVAVNPDELSMPPKIMWDRMFGYGVTKAKELLGE